MARHLPAKIFFKYSIALFIVAVLAFYFWGSSGSLPESELNQIIQSQSPGTLEKDTFTVVSYNLGYLSGMTNNLPVQVDPDLYTGNLERAVNLFREIQPDVVGLQEIDYGSDRSLRMDQLDSLLKHCQIPFAHKSINWDKNYVPFPYWPPSTHFGNLLSGQAIMSKYPINQGERLVLERPSSAPFYYNAFYLDRLIQVAHLSINGRKVIVLNVHLEAFDWETREAQARSLLEVYRKYASQNPVLLLGDFNARPPYAKEIIQSEQTVQLFLDEPDLLPAISKEKYLDNEPDYFTFDTDQPYEKLDYIFYTGSRIRLIDAYVAREAGEISDHLPVVMRFTLIPE